MSEIILGELTVDCMGPHGQIVPVHLVDNFDGTQSVKVKPVEPGRHILNIRYGGDHILCEQTILSLCPT